MLHWNCIQWSCILFNGSRTRLNYVAPGDAIDEAQTAFDDLAVCFHDENEGSSTGQSENFAHYNTRRAAGVRMVELLGVR